MDKTLNLYNLIKAGYSPTTNNLKSITDKGFIKDNELSNGNHQTYFNPITKKLVYNVVGTHNLSDIGTDVLLATGGLKISKRYIEDDQALKKSKLKYQIIDGATITGHSLGSSIGGLIASNNDKVIGLDGGMVGQKLGKNDQEYRSSGDIVSVFGSRNKQMKTLKQPKRSIFNKIGTTLNPIKGILQAHDVENIKDNNIFV